MRVRKYIASTLMAVVLHQIFAAFLYLHPSVRTAADYLAMIGTARAEEYHDLPECRYLLELPCKSIELTIQQAPDGETEALPEGIPPSSEAGAYGPERGYVDALHGRISRRVLASAEWLDSFFEDKRNVREANHSSLRIGYDIFIEDSTDNSVRWPSFNLRLRLPRLEQLGKGIILVVDSEAEADPGGAPVSESPGGNRVLSQENRNTSVALDFLLKTTTEQNLLIRTGTQLGLDQAVLFISPRYRLLKPLRMWDFRFTQDIIFRTGTETEWEAETRFDLERQLPNALFFRTNIDGIWKRNEDDYFYRLGFSLRQPLGLIHAISYGWTNIFVTRPRVLDEIVITILYRRNFWREWLFYEVAPQYRFPRDRDFIPTPGILFRLEANFGYVKK